MRILRRILSILLIAALFGGLAVWGMVHWLESPSGEGWLSRQLTARLQGAAPGTEMILQGVRFHLGIRAQAERLLWRRSTGQEILKANGLEARLLPGVLSGWPPRPRWEVRTEVEQLDLAGLDQALGKGRWRSSGFMAGPARFFGVGAEVTAVDLRLESLPPGGDLSSELLRELAGMMPAGDPRTTLLKALAGKALFHFQAGNVEMTTEAQRYILRLRVDGDHLLDIQIRVPKESVEFLKQVFL